MTSSVKSTVYIHQGGSESISNDASAGLQFLKRSLVTLDSLDPDPPVWQFLSKRAQFAINSDPSIPAEDLAKMFSMRHEKLEKFGHEVTRAWDIIEQPGGKRHTVIFDSVSTTQFKGDSVEIKVAELNVWELEDEGENDELKLVTAKCWMNPSAVHERARQLFSQSS